MKNINCEEYENINFNELNSININDADFLKLTNIKHNIFSKILDILKEIKLEKFKRSVKPNRLPLENRLLMMLTYWREYRT